MYYNIQGSSIFERTDFDGDGSADGIHFGLNRLEIEEDAPEPGSFFAQDFIGVSAFLNEHSTANYSAFCLSYRFTYRDFDDGVVGLAYIGPQPGMNVAGGICEDVQTFSGGVMKTLNTGIVTSLNFGRRIPPSLSALTFAHEAGHNFGAQVSQIFVILKARHSAYISIVALLLFTAKLILYPIRFISPQYVHPLPYQIANTSPPTLKKKH